MPPLKRRQRGSPKPDLPPAPTLAYEQQFQRQGLQLVAGIDEAGRGALAGPVVAGAVILPPDLPDLDLRLSGLRDSKKMTASQRDKFFDLIHEVAVAVSVGQCSAEDIDRIGIVPATRTAMQQAVADLHPAPDALLIDGVILSDLISLPQHALYFGDSIVLSIAAGAVIAKVTRDRLMAEADTSYPLYGFAQHKGYGTAAHRRALTQHGPCRIHRRSYAPVAQTGGPTQLPFRGLRR